MDGFFSGCMRIYCTCQEWYSPRRTGSVNIIHDACSIFSYNPQWHPILYKSWLVKIYYYKMAYGWNSKAKAASSFPFHNGENPSFPTHNSSFWKLSINNLPLSKGVLLLHTYLYVYIFILRNFCHRPDQNRMFL